MILIEALIYFIFNVDQQSCSKCANLLGERAVRLVHKKGLIFREGKKKQQFLCATLALG